MSQPKTLSITFSGIHVPDDFGFGNVNQTFVLKYNRRSDPSAPTYNYSATTNGVIVQIGVGLTEPPNNYAIYTLTPPGEQVANTIFVSAAPGLVLPNSNTFNGGTATIQV